LATDRERTPPASLHKDWHRPARPLPKLRHPTFDWEEWDGRYLWLDTIDGTLLIEEMFKTVFAVPRTIEPLAFRYDGSDAFFIFAAGGRYYLYYDGVLSRCEGEFASKDDFLEREGPWHIVSPPRGFDDVPWMPAY
jgi:hypothetical protein